MNIKITSLEFTPTKTKKYKYFSPFSVAGTVVYNRNNFLVFKHHDRHTMNDKEGLNKSMSVRNYLRKEEILKEYEYWEEIKNPKTYKLK